MKTKELLIFLVILVVSIVVAAGITWYAMTQNSSSGGSITNNFNSQQSSLLDSSVQYENSTTGYTLTSGTESFSDSNYSAIESNESAIIVKDGASLTLTNPTITKTGDTSSDENSSFYGLNAGVIATSGSSLNISGGSINAKGKGANGAFSTGAGTVVKLNNMTINAYGDGAHAVMATQGGSMILTNVKMKTTDSHSGAMATDRGGGTITATGGGVETTGTDSPAVYSTGNITVSDADLLATNSEGAVIEGANIITLNNVSLTTNVTDKWGIMVYQSMSGDALGTEGTFTMNGGKITSTSSSSPLFYANNSTAKINLTGIVITNASHILFKAAANSRWGTSGSNGGNFVIIGDNQILSGDITVDNISTTSLELKNNSRLTGTINSANTGKTVSLTLDETSSWTVSANSYLTNLSGAIVSDGSITNIIGNGHNIYYSSNGTLNGALGGGTYSLVGGGSLIPN